jgi:hypothetical protein
MDIISNTAGHTFIIGAERSTIESNNKRIIVNELKLIANIFPAVCVYAFGKGLHVVSSDKTDHRGIYLLAECLLCDAEPDRNIVYLELYNNLYYLVVRTNGEVIIDSFTNDIRTREILIAMDKEDYRFLVCGAEDLYKTANIRYEAVSSWIESAIPLPEYQLQSAKLAIKPHSFDIAKVAVVSIAALILVMVYVIQRDDQVAIDPNALIDPYQDMRLALQAAPVDMNMILLHDILTKTYLLDAWKFTGLDYKDDIVNIKFLPSIILSNTLPPLEELYALKVETNGVINLNGYELTVSFPITLTERLEDPYIYPARDRFDYIVLSLADFALFGKVAEVQHGQFRALSTSIQLTDVSHDTMLRVAQVLNNEPVVMKDAVISNSNVYNINAVFNIVIFGS